MRGFGTFRSVFEKMLSRRFHLDFQILNRVFNEIGFVHLQLIRKWMQELFDGLKNLHVQTETHDPLIHGRIRLSSLYYFRSIGKVRVGDYYWLTPYKPGAKYNQVKWAREDGMDFLKMED